MFNVFYVSFVNQFEYTTFYVGDTECDFRQEYLHFVMLSILVVLYVSI